MENGIWDGEILEASQVSKDYELEKMVRLASGKRQLICPDPECMSPSIKYCHGEIRGAYFAHIDTDQCDYAQFDKTSGQMTREIRLKLYHMFQEKGYLVHLEVKLLPHHYTHLLLETKQGEQVAVEIGSKHLTAREMDQLASAYEEAGISVKWIVLGEITETVEENHTYFIKRYLLNESHNRDLLVLDYRGQDLSQYKVDTEPYMYRGNPQFFPQFGVTYVEHGSLEQLELDDNGELTIAGFSERYEHWRQRKQDAFLERQKQLDQQYKEEEEMARRREAYLRYQSRQPREERRQAPIPTELWEEIAARMTQQDTPIYDERGNRWVQCERCKKIDTDDKFAFYGGVSHMNLGVCNDCIEKG